MFSDLSASDAPTCEMLTRNAGSSTELLERQGYNICGTYFGHLTCYLNKTCAETLNPKVHKYIP